MYIKKIKNQKGITLVALAITIIVLLILAGITINMTLGEREIFSTAQNAAEKQKIAEYLEKIELARMEVASGNLGQVTLDNLKAQIVKDGIVSENAIVTGENYLKITTKEGYIIVVTIDTAQYIEDDSKMVTPPALTAQDIEINVTDAGVWTNQGKIITLTSNVEGDFTLQYSTNGRTWKDYTGELKVYENGTLYIALRNVLGERGNYAQYEIDKIDKLDPVKFIPTAETTTNSITIDASGANDAEATDKYAKSGIKEIWYSIDEGTTWKTNENKAQTSYTFGNLTQNKDYKIKVKVIDNAGNQMITDIVPATTGEVVLSEGNIVLTPSTTNWTNGDVKVTGTTNVSGYILQVSKTTTFPSTATSVTSVTVSANQTVYARLVDSTNQANGYATYAVDKIDKQIPEVGTLSSTTTSVTIAGTDNLSGIVGYAVTSTNSKPSSFTSCTATTNLSGAVVNNLAQNTPHWVWLKDQAGNVSASKDINTQIQYVTSISVSPSSATVKVGAKTSLSAIVGPSNANSKAYTWSSSNSSVASVSSSGVVTGNAAGTATIYATAGDDGKAKGSCMVTVQSLTKADITAANYGDTVTYSANGEANWKIFYKDSSYVYLILSRLLPYSKVSSSVGMSSQSGKPYVAYWPSGATSMQNTTNYSLFRPSISGVTTSYSLNRSYNNGKAVSSLANTSNWTGFVNTSYADYSIGAPTLEMWCASWNAKGYTKLYCNKTSAYGYYLGTVSLPNSTEQSVKSSPGYNDKLYFPFLPGVANDSTGYSYWLASPSARDVNSLMVVGYGGKFSSQTCSQGTWMSVRPVVRLKSTTNIIRNTPTGNWELK